MPWIKIEVKDSDDDRAARSRTQEETSQSNSLLFGALAGLVVVALIGGAGFLFRDRLFGSGDVVAIVNGEEITRQELATEKALFATMSTLTQGRQVQPPSDFDMLNQMIADRLKYQEASSAGISVSEGTVESQLNDLEAQAGFTDAQVRSALQQAGLDISVLKDWLQRQLIINQYVNNVVVQNAPAEQQQAAARSWANTLQTQADVEIKLSSGDTQQTAKVGEPAPDFTLRTPDGESVSLSDYRGKTVLVNFWATWCPPCKTEMPDMEQLYQKYKDQGLEIIAVDQQEPASAVQAFFEEMGLTFQPVIDSTGEIFNLYRVVALPTSYFIDENGVVQFHHRGMMTAEQMENYASQLMSN